MQVAQRDGGTCVDCPPGTPAWPYGKWQADHVVPLAADGPDTLDNLATRCLPHHRAKSAREKRDHTVGTWAEHVHKISFRTTPADMAFITATAAATGVKQSAVIRAMLTVARRHPDEVAELATP